MALTLHAALVPTYSQMLGAVAGLIDKAEAWCSETGTDPAEFIDARLADDMLPFGYQVLMCWVHSAHAIDHCAKGHFSPYREPWPTTFDGLREVIAKAQAALDAVDPATLEELADKELIFSVGDRYRKEFTVENFLLSFSQPNFFFHVTTAYAIMRGKGIDIGKMAYLGAFRAK